MSVEKAALLFKNKRKLPLIVQSELAECGHACIAMISNYWGHDIDLYGLRKLSKPSIKGVTLLDITTLFEQLHFKTRALQVPLDALHLVKTPAILHWNMNHFVVLKKVSNDSLIIYDPAFGARHCSKEEASKYFTGIALEVEKSSDFSAITATNKIRLSDLVKTAHGINAFLIWLLLLSFIIEFLGLLSPLLMQYVTDDVIVFNDINNLYGVATAFIILLFFQMFTEYIRGSMVIYLTNHLTEQFSSNVVKHLLKLPLNFFEARHKGDFQFKYSTFNLSY